MPTAKKKPKKTVRLAKPASKAIRKPAKRGPAAKAGKKRAAVKRVTATKPVKAVRGLTVAELTAKLRADLPTAPTTLRGGNLPIALINSQYGPASKRTVLAALSTLASEGLVMIVSDGFFQIKGVPPPQG